ncbi:FtsK/SpoIIIE family DNA translocase [Rhizorhabdus dicambivorans]|uniref:DNA translocase FtsK n=1 Tax=Rhizorhabdus dicambivorans TaxID=1850238 RepID=A0A2A4G161_9SPHN|nr:DNA translocase FtsK 4TM domain-containing protein [Rhizorhabdus dicambivorans]ATE66780.1 DNA translocase FtsK [Rhizorhabdus dicambivorans]PCE43733.1 DNA translocase FtsK [Rhizorhabdus dicambivorans]
MASRSIIIAGESSDPAPAEGSGWRMALSGLGKRAGSILSALGLIAATIALGFVLASYHVTDPALNTAAGGPAQNVFGPAGAWVADLALSIFGPAVGLVLPLGFLWGLRLWRGHPVGRWKRSLLVALVAVLLLGVGLALFRNGSVAGLPAGFGGSLGLGGAALVGLGLAQISDPMIANGVRLGAAVLFAILGLSLWVWGLGLLADERDWLFRRGAYARRPREPHDEDGEVPFDEADFADIEQVPVPPRPPRYAPIDETAEQAPPPVVVDRKKAAAPSAKAVARERQSSLPLGDTYKLPSLSLLSPPAPSANKTIDKAALERNARLLETVLDDFNVKGRIVEIRPGPVVTMYELEPAAGIKASRVIALADDIARNMSAMSARIAVIPGRTVIGIELPNAKRETVSLSELIASDAFEDLANGGLALVLGKNIGGDPVIADLAPMPHLLVAGTTGSGKSVGINSMILSLLYRLTPDQCRMIMIDPKMLELSIYDDIPHLLSPVVTEPQKAVRALKWAVEQMEDRYRMMSSVGVRGLASFNERVRNAKAKGQPLGRKVQTGYDAETGQPIYEEEKLEFEPLPQIVVIVDELADLMMTAGKEVEFLIQRLAQKARAAGIHLIMATQRPSVDVITGVIKANLPTRISFQVTSKIDSRTILGEQGAEQLLGKGDMLYMAGGKQIIRVHGPFVSDDEVRAVADHWRGQGTPDYIQAVTEEPEDGGFAMEGGPTGPDDPETQVYRRAIQLVVENRKASTSWLQRQLRVGYNSAARLIERLEKDGIVSSPDHVGRREVQVDVADLGRFLN